MMARSLHQCFHFTFFGNVFYAWDRRNNEKRSLGADPRRPHAVR